ncbi:MAG: hypothetical protein ACMUIA_01040 [bacterium]
MSTLKSADSLSQGLSSEDDGEAFRLSGPALDWMKGDQRLVSRTAGRKFTLNFMLSVPCWMF